jgi:glutathione peroxidase
MLPLLWAGSAHNGMLKDSQVPDALSSRGTGPWQVTMIDRRTVLSIALAGITGLAATRSVSAQASRMSAYVFKFPALDGGEIRLSDYAGRPLLVVNTASKCGYTPQYAGLQELWTEFGGRGLMILGVPSNDFGAQEPGGATEIANTAQQHYGVKFPIAAKAVVKGPNAHPFYKWAADLRPKDVPRWNFHKYLVGRDGYIADVFPEVVEPTDTRVKTAIARTLAAS